MDASLPSDNTIAASDSLVESDRQTIDGDVLELNMIKL